METDTSLWWTFERAQAGVIIGILCISVTMYCWNYICQHSNDEFDGKLAAIWVMFWASSIIGTTFLLIAGFWFIQFLV